MSFKRFLCQLGPGLVASVERLPVLLDNRSMRAWETFGPYNEPTRELAPAEAKAQHEAQARDDRAIKTARR